MRARTKSTAGFSLLEVIVYVAILAVVTGVFVGVFDTVTRTQLRENSRIELDGQVTFALQTIQKLVKDSSLIAIDTGVPTTTLRLHMSSSSTDPTIIYVQNGKLYVQQGSSTAQTITDSAVSVDEIEFFKIENAGAKDIVKLTLAMSQALSGGTTETRNVQSSISRVNAVTFDSSLLPPTDGTYDVGTWPSLRWRNGAFSGQLRATEICIVDNCITSWGGSGVTGTGEANNIPLWSGASSLSTSTIFSSSGNIGIGTTTPSQLLTVYGSIAISSSTGAFITSDGYKLASAAKAQYFIIENPTASEDDAFFIFDKASTIRKVYAVNKVSGDTVTFNLFHSTSRATATSSASAVFASYQTNTATTTPTAYTSFSDASVDAGAVLRFVTSAASSTQFLMTIYYDEQ